MRGPDDVVALMRRLDCDCTTNASEIVVGLDVRRRLTGIAVRPHDAHPLVDWMQLGDLADALVADAVVLVTLLEDEALVALESDGGGFVNLRQACARHDVTLIDHILIAGRQWRSLRECALSEGRGA
jgi:hypothetical protein